MDSNNSKCPFCGEEIPSGAEKCRYCEETLNKKELTIPDILSWINKTGRSAFAKWRAADAALRKKILLAAGAIAVVLVILMCFVFGGERVEDVALPPGRSDHQLLEYTEKGDLRAVKYLIVKKGAQVNGTAYGNNRETALHIALRNGFNDIAAYLIKKGADVNAVRDQASGETALHIAVGKNSLQSVELLLKHKAAVDPVNENGQTPLLLAVKNNCDPEIVGLLINNRANINAADSDGNTALHLAVNEFPGDIIFYPRPQSPAYAKLLLATNIDINARNREGKTALQLAGNADTINQLLRHKAVVTGDGKNSRLIRLPYERHDLITFDLVDAILRSGADQSDENELKGLKKALAANNESAAAALISHMRFAPGQPMHNVEIAISHPKLIRMMIDRGKHMGEREIGHLPPDLTKYYLEKNCGGGVDDRELHEMLYNLYERNGDYTREHLAEWNGLIARAVSSASWENIEMLILRYKNRDLVRELIPKIAVNEEDNRLSAIKAMKTAGWNDLVQALIASKKVSEAECHPEKYPSIYNHKTVRLGQVLLPYEGESRTAYGIRFRRYQEKYRKNTGNSIVSYYSEVGKRFAKEFRDRQINCGQEPDGIEVKGEKPGEYEIYSELRTGKKTANAPAAP